MDIQQVTRRAISRAEGIDYTITCVCKRLSDKG